MIADNDKYPSSGLERNGHSAPAEGDGVIQIDLLGLCQRRWRLIVFGVVLCTSLAAVYYVTATRIYESSTEILVIPKDTKLTSTTSTADLAIQSAGDELLATHMKIITSPQIIQQALVTANLMSLDSIRKVAAENQEPHLTDVEYVIDYVRDNLGVERGGSGSARDAQVLTAKFRHTNEQDCATILLAIYSEYQEFLGKTVKGAGQEAAELITEASARLEDELDRQDQEYQQALRDAPFLWSQNGENLNPQYARIVRLEDELTLLRRGKSRTESRLALARSVIDADVVDPLRMMSVFDGADVDRLSLLVQIDNGYPLSEAFQATVPAANVEAGELLALNLESKRSALLYGPNHPKARELQQQIRQVKSYLSEKHLPTSESARTASLDIMGLVPLYASLLSSDLEDFQQQEKDLVVQLDEEKRAARDVISSEIEVASLKRKMDRTQGLFDAVVKRLEEISLLRDYGGFITKMLSAPRIGEKAWPKGSLILPAGAMLGAFLGGALAIAAELLDRSFRTPEDIESELGVPVLSHIPLLADRTSTDDAFEDVSPTIVAIHSPKSRDAEAFRTLRTTLMFKATSSSNPVIQFTSPNAGDGKSTLICNLAISTAQASRRVLLIDADMRRPTVGENVGLEQSPGLSEVLASIATLDDVIQPHSASSNLSVITSGTVPPNPAELLSTSLFADLIEEVRSRFDWILIDSPPVNAVSDPLVIAPHADHVVMALTLGSHARSTAMNACRQLADVGANLSGLVVNRAIGGAGKYGNQSYSYRQYGYRYRGDSYEGSYHYSNDLNNAYYRNGSKS